MFGVILHKMDKNKLLTLFAALVFIAAVLIQYTQSEVPVWLLTVLSNVLMYVFGLHTDTINGNKE